MKKILYIALYLVASLCNAQTIVLYAFSESSPSSKVYTPIPSPPEFTDSHLLIESSTGNSIQIGDTGGKTELIFGSNYLFAQLNSLTGLYKLKTLNSGGPGSWQQFGGSGQAAAISAAVATPQVEYYNMYLKQSNNTVKMPPAVVGQSQFYQNFYVDTALFAGFLINESVVGQQYGPLQISFARVRGSGGEALYLGNTGSQNTTFDYYTIINNLYTRYTGREGIQANGHADLRIDKVTCNVGGLEGSAGIGQNNCFQIQNVYTGHLKDAIFWNFRAPAMIATEDFLFEDLFMNWYTSNREIYLQDMTANGYTKYKHVGGTVHFKNVTFYNPAYTLAWVFRIQDDECNYIFENCIFPTSAVDIYKDERTDKTTYSITVINPTFTDSPPLPQFVDPPEAEYVGFEQVIGDDHYYNRGMGYRTPD